MLDALPSSGLFPIIQGVIQDIGYTREGHGLKPTTKQRAADINHTMQSASCTVIILSWLIPRTGILHTGLLSLNFVDLGKKISLKTIAMENKIIAVKISPSK